MVSDVQSPCHHASTMVFIIHMYRITMFLFSNSKCVHSVNKFSLTRLNLLENLWRHHFSLASPLAVEIPNDNSSCCMMYAQIKFSDIYWKIYQIAECQLTYWGRVMQCCIIGNGFPQEQTSVKWYSKFKHSGKCIWKCCLENIILSWPQC